MESGGETLHYWAEVAVRSKLGNHTARLMYLSLLCLSLLPLSGRAEVVSTLYQAEVLVASQGSRARTEAAAQGLADVVVRVSGVPEAGQLPRVMGAMSKPLRWLEAFHYESTDELLEHNGVEVSASRLILRYSASAIEQLLRDAGLPVWPANRPSVLVWMVQDDVVEGRRVVSLLEQPEVLEATQAVSERRGLPMVTPLLDLQDQMALSADDLWGLDENLILNASSRYQADAVVVGRYTQTSGGQWRATWLLLHKGSREVFDSRGLDTAAWVDDGFGQVVSYLAGMYAIVPQIGTSEAVVMELDGVETFADYFQALKYLQDLAMVNRADPSAVSVSTLRLNLFTEGSVSLLLDALALDNRLKPKSVVTVSSQSSVTPVPVWQMGPQGSANNPLRYEWPVDR